VYALLCIAIYVFEGCVGPPEIEVVLLLKMCPLYSVSQVNNGVCSGK